MPLYLYPVARPAPLMEPQYYKSYILASPPRTHWRPATCEEYQCADYLYGFVTTVDLSTELGQRQAYFIRHDTTRRWHEQRVSLELAKFICGPGNRCVNWQDHKVPIGRPPRLIVAGGDWRGNPTGMVRRHIRVEDWVEDFAEHQNRLADIVQRG